MGNLSRLLLASVEDVKNYLGKPDTDVQDDDLIYDLLRGTCEDIEHYCDRKFNARIYQEYWKGDGTNMLLLKQYPIINIGGNIGGNNVMSGIASGEYQDAFGNISQVTNMALGIRDDVSYVFDNTTIKPALEIIVSFETPGKIQLAGDIFINSQLWSYYNVENLQVFYVAGYVQIPRKIRMGAVKLTALDYMRSKGQLSSIEWEKDPAKMAEEVWNEMDKFRRVM